jgi:DNA polymerase V
MFGLADANSFYCSCEQVFDPTTVGRPVVVLSNNDGCVIARNKEAKAIGIPMGEPAHLVKNLIETHHVAVFSSNYALYGDMSARVMGVLGEFTPDLEIYSIDEAFLDLSGFDHLNLWEYGRYIVKTVRRSTGIPLSLGVAPTKSLAKVANKLAKKGYDSAYPGVCVLDKPTLIEQALKDFPIGDVWGIGGRYTKKLILMGIRTAADFTQLPSGWVHKNMTIMGLRLWKELRGERCYDVDTQVSPKKNICTARSFGKMLNRLQDIEEALCNHTASCAEKLRQQRSCASVIMVFICTNPFRPDTPQYSNAVTMTLPHPSNNTAELIKWARLGLKQIFKEGYFYKKTGVIVSALTPENISQMHLFRNNEMDEKYRTLMTVVDTINVKYGRRTIRSAAQGTTAVWKLRQEKRSPRYTTRWEDILVVGKRA